MCQRKSSALRRHDAASLKHVGGQFESRATVASEEYIMERDEDLQNSSAQKSGRVENPTSNRSEWLMVTRQLAPMWRLLNDATVPYIDQTTLSAVTSQTCRQTMSCWHLEATLAQPWDGLRQVSRKSKTMMDDSRSGDSNKACSIDTCRDSTSRDSSYEGECRNRFSWLVKDMPLTYV
jgi:hypothetical protein